MIIIISAYSQEKEIFISDRLEKKWETPSDFKVPESVCYDPINQVLYDCCWYPHSMITG